jgi:hypothetical protein
MIISHQSLTWVPTDKRAQKRLREALTKTITKEIEIKNIQHIQELL